MPIGFDIVIPNSLINKISEADEKLQALATTAEDTQKRVNSAFKAMVDGDLNDFIKKVEQVNKEVSKLGNAKLQIDSTNTTKNIDDINKLIAALEKLLIIQKTAPKSKESRNNVIYNIGEQAEQSIDKINKLINSIDKIQFGGQTYTNSALTKVNSEIDSAVEKLTELQKRIDFYAKGEGQKSIAYVDIKSMNEEAKILMNQIDLLQRKRESIIANANLRLKVDEQRRIRDNAWFEMEEEKRQRERENAKQASDRARESSKEYEKTYNDTVKAYSEMFDVLEAKQLKVYENLFIEAEKKEKQEKKRIDEQIKEYDNIIQKLKELYEIKNKADQVKGDFNYSSALRFDASQVSDDTLKQIQELNRRRFELENELLDKLDDIKAKHRKENFKEELKFEEKANAEAEKKRKERQKKRIADESKQRKKDYERTMAYGDTYDHTLRVSNRAKTLNQELLAVKALERERGKLKKTDADYEQKLKELNKRIREHNASINRAREGANQLRQSHSNLMNISEQLTRRLALVFSVSQVTGYVKKLASVRGEFELQQKSLAAIIQNKDQANIVFDKVTKLAVQSPFQLKELVTYTKQLAAYKIETGKLYDNIKMIADISAGVGVDMSRLVLAYGQVASANYLRGTELRQFSEAGVNILGGLADYFSKLQGRVVGVAEVFDMVSRRMVKFSDVEEVLRRMTEAGGEFYNMQAIQAQTLKGQISNLKDSIEIMLNDIGKSQEGKLKGGVALVRDLVENWRAFASVLQDVSVALVIKGGVDLYKGFRVAKDDLGSFIEEAKGLPKIAAGIKKMFFDIQKAIVAHPYIALAAAIAVVGKALWDWNKAVEAQNKVYKENSAALANEIRNVEKLKDKYEQFSKTIVKAETDMQKARDDNDQDAYNKAQNDANLARKEQLALLDQLKREYPEIYAGLNSEKVGTEELTAAIEEYNNAKRTQIALNEGKKASFWGGDSEGENINDAQSEINEYMSLLETAKGKIGQTLSRLEVNFYEGIINKEQYEEARKLLLDTEKAIIDGLPIDEIVKKQDAFEAYAKTLNMSFRKNFGDLTIAINDAKQQWKNGYGFLDFFGVEDSFDDIRDKWEDNIDIYKAEWYKLGEIDETTEAGKTAAKKYLDGMIAQLESKDKYVINAFKDWLRKKLGAQFLEPEDENGGGKGNEPQLEWVKRVKDDLADIQKQMPKNIEYLQSIFEGLDFTIKLPENQEDYEEYYKLVVQWVDKIRNAYNRALNDTDKLVSKEETEALKMALGFAEQYLATVGGGKQKKEEDPIDKTSEQIRVLKEMHKAYLDLNKTFDETTSKQGAIDKFGNAFKEAFDVDVSKWGFDFTTEEGVVAAFDKLIKSIPDQKKRVQAELAKGEFVMEYKLQLKTDQDKDLKNELQSYFDQYESMLELNKLGISGDAAYSLFGVESMDLDKLRSVVDQFKDQFIGTDMEDEYKKFQDKLTEMEVKAQQERLKKYLGNIRDNISDRAKLKIEELQKLKEIEDSFVAKEGASEEEKQAIETAKKIAIEGLKESTKQQLQKMDWEDFQKSDYFISMFDDLDNASSMAINSMITQLENYKDQWTDMPLDDMKKVIDLINKLKDAADEKITNPFYAAKKTEREIAEYGRNKSESESDFETFTNMSNYAEEQARLYEQALIAKTKILTVEEQEKMLGKENMHLLSMSSEELAKQRDSHKDLSKYWEEQASSAQQQLQRYAKLTNQYEKQAQVLADIRGTFNNLVGAATELGEALGMDEMSKMWTEIGGNIFDTGLAIAEGVLGLKAQKLALDENATAAEKFGYSMNMALGIIGYIVMAIQLVAKVITAINEAHDNKLQKQIERDAEAVELLQKRYEKLEEAIDNAMSFGEYQQAFDENKRNLEEQIRLTEDMIALEEDKKKTDEDAIKGYKDNIEEYNEQLQEMEEKRISDMGGFGSDNAYKDAAESFIDAWLSAYKETGDGLEALQGQWDEYFDNLVKKQMTMHIANKYIKGLLEQVDKAIGANGIVTGDEMSNLKAMAEQSSIELNAIMKQFADAFGIEGLTDGTKLEGLSESIQGVTEVTAQALEAILNSMRFYVIDNNKQLIDIANTLLSWENPTSPILAELKAQTSYLSSIESLFNSVVDRNGSPAVRVR